MTLCLAKAIGLVARSHVVSFDCAVKELESSYQIRAHEKQQGAYLAYHMALLRVADLLHIGVDRAPPERRALLKPTSPVSTLEWEKMHLSGTLTVGKVVMKSTSFLRAICSLSRTFC